MAMAVLLSSYIWGWGGAFPGHYILCLILYFLIGLSGHLRRGERAAELGIRLDNWRLAAWNCLRAVFPLLLIPLALGAPLGTVSFPPLRQWLPALVDGSLWGALQQYGLLCVFYRRFCEILPGERARMLATGAVFGFFHLPNPFLSIVTLGAGALSCWLYRRAPNLIVIGVTHAVVTFVIVHSLPDTITFGMRVGPGFFNFQPGLD
jgi:hypothetical protein